MQLYIWRFKGEDQIRVFAMTRLVMGNKPSANSSQIALKETAFLNDNAVCYPEAKKTLVENSYVDNSFTIADDVQSIHKNIEEIEAVAATGGFYYKPWIISGQDIDDKAITSPDIEDERALGVFWDVKNDKFYIKVSVGSKKRKISLSLFSYQENPQLKLTLRDCLSLHSKAFDPLGMILPVKMIGNLLFRQTIQFLSHQAKTDDKPTSKLPWDKEVSGVIKDRWLEYFSMLDSVKDVKFRRSIKPDNVDPDVRPHLATFSDGNENSFGCVAYALWTLKDGSMEARLIMSKAKLGPLLAKGETVKNELAGATYAARLKTWIIQNTGIYYDKHYPFLDSRIVQDIVHTFSIALHLHN